MMSNILLTFESSVNRKRFTKSEMFARHKLKTQGKLVLYHAVKEPMVDYMRSLSRDDQNYWIHDTLDGALHDAHRFRAFVADTPAREFAVLLMRIYKTYFPESYIQEMRFLKTTGGSEDQLVRREFPIGQTPMDVSSLPGSLIVATQDCTYFYGYGWNRAVPLRSDQQIIELNKGDILLLRGDYLYGAAGSCATKVCIQAFLDSPHYVRPNYHIPEIGPVIEDTRDVDDVFCYVWKCPFISTNQKSLLKHLNKFHGFFFNRTQHSSP